MHLLPCCLSMQVKSAEVLSGVVHQSYKEHLIRPRVSEQLSSSCLSDERFIFYIYVTFLETWLMRGKCH